jgi:hypothetical protein
MARNELRPELGRIIPERLKRLPIDDRGYPIPWFASVVKGKPDLRLADPLKFARAVRARRCWICGGGLGKGLVFVVGPASTLSRETSEPPMHIDCAKFAVKACPFLVNPRARYRDAKLPETAVAPTGLIKANPGAMALWVADTYALETDPMFGTLVIMGDPSSVMWYARGERATRAQVLDAYELMLPTIRAKAASRGPQAMHQVEHELAEMEFWFPDEEAVA